MRDVTDKFRSAFDRRTELDSITSRWCESDRYEGTEYKFYGNCIPVRPIIDVVSEEEDMGIESILHVDEGEPKLIVFVADLSNSSHPAFV